MQLINSYRPVISDLKSGKTEVLIPDLGLAIPIICLPSREVDLDMWPVIACDQFTSQPEYWQETADIIGSHPSTLALVLPELYLENPGSIPVKQRIRMINSAMEDYLSAGLLDEYPAGCVLIDRATPLHRSRKGLVIAIDLEQYDFTPGNKKLVRATEGTVIERIPPRQDIRRDATLEIPHVQLLIDDRQKTVIEPLFQYFCDLDPLYDVDLIKGGGHIRGWYIPADHQVLESAIAALRKLNSLSADGLLFAVGDGNHSLATAQAHWFEIKNSVETDHPARYALVELINIHDDGLEFEPIHRAVFGVNNQTFLDSANQWILSKRQSLNNLEFEFENYRLPVYMSGKTIFLDLPIQSGSLATASLQEMLDILLNDWQKSGLIARIDYIHGHDTVKKLADEGAIGMILPEFSKNSFFSTIAENGILPRKTFSMGEAFEKRYYFECRRIKQARL